MIRPASPKELSDLSALCLRSKGYWGYDATFLAACREELTLSNEELETTTVVVYAPSAPMGVLQIETTGASSELLKLFVDPQAIGQGIGTALFMWATAEARRQGADKLRIESDPHAAPFYRRMGATEIGRVPSGSVAGRLLPLFEFRVTDPVVA